MILTWSHSIIQDIRSCAPPARRFPPTYSYLRCLSFVRISEWRCFNAQCPSRILENGKLHTARLNGSKGRQRAHAESIRANDANSAATISREQWKFGKLRVLPYVTRTPHKHPTKLWWMDFAANCHRELIMLPLRNLSTRVIFAPPPKTQTQHKHKHKHCDVFAFRSKRSFDGMCRKGEHAEEIHRTRRKEGSDAMERSDLCWRRIDEYLRSILNSIAIIIVNNH